MQHSGGWSVKRLSVVLAVSASLGLQVAATTVTGSFTPLAAGSNVNLTTLGKLDWVQWGLGGDYKVNRKASVTPQISNFTLTSLNSTNDPLAFSSPYWLDDTNGNSCSWADGDPVVSTNGNYTRVLAYAYPIRGASGFKLTVPAATKTNILSVFVGTIEARGEFKATLPGQTYSNSQLGPSVNGVYTLAFSANAPGQTLTVTWTLPPGVTNGYVTLEAAALTAPGADNPPFATLTNPTNEATFAAPANVELTGIAEDFDGTVTNVAFYADGTKLGQDATSPFAFTWSNAPLGQHRLAAIATDNLGVSRSSVPVEVFVYGTGGSETGSVKFPPGAVDLTAEGTTDWVHWGLTADTNNVPSVDRKSGVPIQISDFTPLGTAPVQRYADNYTGFSWSDGTPTATASGTTTGAFITGLSNGFYLALPADTNTRRLRLYVGAYAVRGHLLAYLSDFSAKPYIDSSIYDSGWNNEYAVYTIDYSAPAAGPQLIVTYRSSELLDEVYGNVTLQSATLIGAVGNVAPTANITNPTNGVSFLAPANILIAADASDPDGSVSKVEFFENGNKLGEDASYPYSVNWTNVGVGTYSLTVRATDNLGATTISSLVSISVTNTTLLPVTLQNPQWSGGNFYFSFMSESNRTYDVLSVPALGSNGWQVLTTLNGTGGLLTATNPAPAAASFYRIQTK